MQTVIQQKRIEAIYQSWIGKQVTKEKKPFKSGSKVNTVKGLTINPDSGQIAFTFIEDDSIVNCSRCILVEGRPDWADVPFWVQAIGIDPLYNTWAHYAIRNPKTAISVLPRPRVQEV